jgi:hypothetical protein
MIFPVVLNGSPLVFGIMGRKWTDGVREKGTEENILTKGR